ncbi:hypothetical protein F511_06617 [Dorcoceras hygrometricum]|uniref:Uncharacterized protein n=1 Tax=Dorcoceras hygrometricum TaxID=472368 RepID=A0A2Z7AMZ0_9LAMI|nr:hypothetical protein F511_06617 [Dorcoceras hygrometricum]
MEHTGVVRMFQNLVDTGLEGFLAASGSIYDVVVIEFFANARVIAGNIVSFIANRKLAMTNEIFAGAFGLPTEGATSFLDVPKETVVEMQNRFSGSEVPFRAPNTVQTAGKTPTGDEFIGCGPEGHERIIADQEEQTIGTDSNAEGYEERMEYETQNDQGVQDESSCTTVQDEQEMFTTGYFKGETFEIADWVDKADGTENEESGYQRDKVTGATERALVVRPAPEHPSQPSLTFTGSGIFTPIEIQEINWVTYFLPKIDPASKGKETLVVLAKPIPVEEHCQLVLNSAWDDVSARMDTFDEWVHFRKEVRIKDVSSLEHLAQIEEHLLLWGESEQVSELFERRSLIIKKIREIARQDRDLRLLAGLSIVAPEASIAGDAASTDTLQITMSPSSQPRIPALEFSTQDEQEQAAARKADQPDVQIQIVNQVVEQIEDTKNVQLGFTDGQRGQPVPETEDHSHHSQAG